MNIFSRGMHLPVLTLFLILSACNGGKKDDSNSKLVTLYSRSQSDTDMLNPINLSSADGRYMANLIFAKLLEVDPETYELKAYMAVSRPAASEITDEGPYKGNLKLDFEIRPEATWDDGSPVTAED